MCYVSVAFNRFVGKEFCWFVLVLFFVCRCSSLLFFVCRLCLSAFVRLCWSLLVDFDFDPCDRGHCEKKGRGDVETAMQFFVVSSRYCALLALSYRYTV